VDLSRRAHSPLLRQSSSYARASGFSLPALLSIACMGIVEGQRHSDHSGESPAPNPQGTAGAGATGGASTTSSVPFKVRNTEPELVPFDMRVRRIATAIGVDVENPMFADMYASNLKLGDYDYANGALPDGSWNANRIAVWVDALKPVCGSPEMKAKYPALPANLPELVRAAWGHLPSSEDTADFASALGSAGLDAATSYEATCMAVFSAAEFVYR
jgi:hypothetical protein